MMLPPDNDAAHFTLLPDTIGHLKNIFHRIDLVLDRFGFTRFDQFFEPEQDFEIILSYLRQTRVLSLILLIRSPSR